MQKMSLCLCRQRHNKKAVPCAANGTPNHALGLPFSVPEPALGIETRFPSGAIWSWLRLACRCLQAQTDVCKRKQKKTDKNIFPDPDAEADTAGGEHTDDGADQWLVAVASQHALAPYEADALAQLGEIPEDNLSVLEKYYFFTTKKKEAKNALRPIH